MPSGWNVYYVVFLSAILALAIPILLGLVSFLVSKKAPKQKAQAAAAPVSTSPALGRRINTRFFLSANVALVLITLALVMIPCAGILNSDASRAGIVRALISILTISSFSALGLLYAARKGDLDWLRSFTDQNEGEGS